jgi:hypothetical protein
MIRRLYFMVGVFGALWLSAVPSWAQDNQGPIPPPPKFEVKRIPAVPHPGPPPIPEQEIIRRFAANEDVMKKVYDTYNFTEAIRVEELDSPGGKFIATGEVYTKPDGSRYWRVTKRPESSLKVTSYSLEDVRMMVSMPLFSITSAEVQNYSFLYAGQDKLDDLNTYVFQVKPKELSRTRRFFEGAIWVDDRDLTIVKSYGKFVNEISGNGTKLPFTMFETYRENFQEKYWLPTYTNSDDFINEPDGSELHLRLVVRSTDFKLTAPQAAVSGVPAPPASSRPDQPTPRPSPPESEFPQPDSF